MKKLSTVLALVAVAGLAAGLVGACGTELASEQVAGPSWIDDEALARVGAREQPVQSRPASEFNGTYDMSCSAAAINLRATFNGQVGGINIPVPCMVPTAAEQQRQRAEISAQCVQAKLPKTLCDQIAAGLVKAGVDFVTAALGVLPDTIDVAVRPNDWLGKVFGVHTTDFTHHPGTGAAWSYPYLLNNNDGGNRGTFLALGLGVGAAGAVPGLACADIGTGVAGGKIDSAAGYTMSYAFSLARDGACIAVAGGKTYSFSLGVAYIGTLTGQKQ